MYSDRTTPTDDNDIVSDDNDDDNSTASDGSKKTKAAKFMRKISFDDFEVSGEVVFSRPGVLVQTKRQDRLHGGTLEVTDTDHGVFVTWDRDTTSEDVKNSNHHVTNNNKVMINDQVYNRLLITLHIYLF